MSWNLEATAPQSMIADALRDARAALYDDDPGAQENDEAIASAIAAVDTAVNEHEDGWFSAEISGDASSVTVTVSTVEAPKDGLVATSPEALPPSDLEAEHQAAITPEPVEPEPKAEKAKAAEKAGTKK